MIGGAGWGLGGVAGAGLGLIVLEVIVANPNAYGGVASLLQLPGEWAAGWLDASTPLLKAGSSPASSSSSSSTPASSPASAPFGGLVASAINPGFATPGASGGKKKKG